MTLPSILIIIVTLVFLILERLYPGRTLPNSKGWYGRSFLINVAQILITLLTAKLWIVIFGKISCLKLAQIEMPIVEGFVGWFVGTFFFYWWHRIRHKNGFWLIFHQIHHSPSLIEALTSFYKHPIEILSDSFLSGMILYPLLGCSFEGTIWFNFFAATGEYFYHSNIRTPKWVRFFIQTPELHSIHHEFDLHKYNYSDIPIWDRLFGTYKDTTEFSPRCGFPEDAEHRLKEMLLFKDVYHTKSDKKSFNDMPREQ